MSFEFGINFVPWLIFRQILDQEEEIAQSEFEKLEKRLGHDPQSEKRDSR